MTETTVPSFVQAYTDFVYTHILGHLSSAAQTQKGITWSVQEMASCIPSLPAKSSGTPATIQMPQLPGILASPANGVSTGVSGGGRSKKGVASGSTQTGPGCQYIYVRGVNKGKMCGLATLDGSIYCRACIKKKTGGGSTANVEGSSPSSGGSFVGGQQVDTESTEIELKVIPFKDNPEFFKETKYGLICRKLKDKSVLATAIEDGGKLRPLNDNEKAIAEKLGMCVIDDSEEDTENTTSSKPSSSLTPQTAPTVTPTKVSTVNPVVIPTISSPAIPKVTGLPTYSKIMPQVSH
jgi:hypothetical protein